jgi:hypothetical protein
MKQPIEQRGDHVELLAIEGEQLSAVTFVQDYVQLHFDGPTITAVTRPVVVAGDSSLDFGAPGYRDGLCGLIGRIVGRAYVRPADRLQIDFADRASLIVSLKPEAYRAGEAVIFTDGRTEQWASW